MKEVTGHIVSIFCTLVFFIIGTVMWYKLHLNYESVYDTLSSLSEVYVLEDVNLSNLKKVDDSKVSNIDSYRLVIDNNEDITKKVLIKLIDDYSDQYTKDKIDNNYLHYMIKKDNGSYSDIRSLNMNGEIYFDDLDANSESVYEIKVWVSDNYQNEVDYHGNFVVIYL